MKCLFSGRIVLLLMWAFAATAAVNGQSANHSLYGDVRVDESKVGGLKPLSLELILYTDGRVIVSRQSVSTNGSYRFNNLPAGFFDLVVEVEGQEITRVRVDLSSPLLGDRRQDLFLEWKPTGAPASRPSVISAADRYERNSANTTLFENAGAAIDKKRFDEAAELLHRIVVTDPRDFQAWTELANVHLLQEKYVDAENEYLRAIDLHANFFLALLNLGRVEVAQKKYDIAVEVLSRATKARPQSPDANYLLGESYLQLKKGSLAAPYLNEALRLDPQGMAEVHLRLALLYHGAGMKDKAAAEYEAFLKKKPDYSERRKLEKYIAENKKP